MGIVKLLFTLYVLFVTQNIVCQTKKPFYENIRFGMEGSIGIALEPINTKSYYLKTGGTIEHASGKNEPLYGAGFTLGYYISQNHLIYLKQNTFIYTYDWQSFGINLLAVRPHVYEIYIIDYTDFRFNSIHLNYQYSFNLGMVKPYLTIGFGKYQVELDGFGNLGYSDSSLNPIAIYRTHDNIKFSYLNIKPGCGIEIFFNQYFGMNIYASYGIPLNKPKEYSYSYDEIAEETELITKVERAFVPARIFSFGFGFFFKIPEIKKASK